LGPWGPPSTSVFLKIAQARFADDAQMRMNYTSKSNVNREADEDDAAVTGERAPGRADRQRRIIKSAHKTPFSKAASVDSNGDMFRRPDRGRTLSNLADVIDASRSAPGRPTT
jgi:hypothetical protein